MTVKHYIVHNIARPHTKTKTSIKKKKILTSIKRFRFLTCVLQSEKHARRLRK